MGPAAAIAWSLGTLLLFGGYAVWDRMRQSDISHLVHDGVEAKAIVLRHESHRGNNFGFTVHYKYQADGALYQGVSGIGRDDYDLMADGQYIPIKYLRDRPGISAFKPQEESSTRLIVLGSLLVIAVVVRITFALGKGMPSGWLDTS
jgi:hypothetical protein